MGILFSIFFPSQMKEHIPSLAVSISSGCNLRCLYCPVEGDDVGGLRSGSGDSIGRRQPGVEDVRRTLLIAHDLGFRKFRFTGGEPTINPEFSGYVNLMDELLSRSQGTRILLNTNGVLLNQCINELSEVVEHLPTIRLDGGLKRPPFLVAVSLDTFDRRKYREITQFDALPKIIENIELCATNGIPTRVNMVVTLGNVAEVQSMAEFCARTGVSLKLLDLNWSPDYTTKNPNFWEENYFPLSRLGGSLERQFGLSELVMPHGGYGIPEKVFSIGDKGGTVTLKSCTEGTTFCSGICSSCNLGCQTHSNGLFKCQEGMYQIFVSTSQTMSLCRYGPPETTRFDLASKSEEDIRGLMRRAIAIFGECRLSKPKLRDQSLDSESIEGLGRSAPKERLS